MMHDRYPWDKNGNMLADAQQLSAAYRAFFTAGEGFPDPLTSSGLPAEHAVMLKTLAPSADIGLLVAVADIAFAEADAHFTSKSGPWSWFQTPGTVKPVSNEARAAVELATNRCFGASTFGLEWVSELARLRPEVSTELLAALRRADKLFRHVIWFDERGWELSLGRYFEDCSTVLTRKKADLETILAKSAEVPQASIAWFTRVRRWLTK